MQAQGTSEHITALCAASAAGLPLPPMIIYVPEGQYRFEGPDDTLYVTCESSWIVFNLVEKDFSQACGYAAASCAIYWWSQISPKFDLCRQNEITLFCLALHTTHVLQPLDVSVFKLLKGHYSKSVHSLTFAKPSFTVTKREFSRVIQVPFEPAFSITNIKAGFSKCGIYPFNPDAIEHAQMLPSELYISNASASERSMTFSPMPFHGDSSSGDSFSTRNVTALPASTSNESPLLATSSSSDPNSSIPSSLSSGLTRQ